jgi:hypothetical protein
MAGQPLVSAATGAEGEWMMGTNNQRIERCLNESSTQIRESKQLCESE